MLEISLCKVALAMFTFTKELVMKHKALQEIICKQNLYKSLLVCIFSCVLFFILILFLIKY